MSFARKYTISVTTDGSGDATEYSTVANGRIISVAYAKTDFADGVDFAITTETTAQNLWVDTNINASETVAPRQSTHDATGVVLTYTGDADVPSDYIWAVDERIKVVVSSGGDTKTGTITVIVA